MCILLPGSCLMFNRLMRICESAYLLMRGFAKLPIIESANLRISVFANLRIYVSSYLLNLLYKLLS